MNKKLLLSLGLCFIAFIASSQSYKRTYSLTGFTDFVVYGNRVYILNEDSTNSFNVTKSDMLGNVIWTNRYIGTSMASNKLISANGGRILLNSTGGSNTPFITIDTVSGNVVNSFIYFPCPPNPQTKSDRVVTLDNGITVKLGCDPISSKTTIYTINSITGATVSAKSISNFTGTNLKITKLGFP